MGNQFNPSMQNRMRISSTLQIPKSNPKGAMMYPQQDMGNNPPSYQQANFKDYPIQKYHQVPVVQHMQMNVIKSSPQLPIFNQA